MTWSFTNFVQKWARPGRIYLIPTGQGFIFLATSLITSTIGIIYANNLVLLMGLILCSVFVMSAFYGHFTLAGLTPSAFAATDTYQGTPAALRFQLANSSAQAKSAIRVGLFFHAGHGDSHFIASVPAAQTSAQEIPLNLPGRGQWRIKTVRFSTRFPFGLFYSWSFWPVDASIYVYPPRRGLGLEAAPAAPSAQGGLARQSEEGDLDGHRRFIRGDSFKRLNWKYYARSGHLMIKEFTQEMGQCWSFPLRSEGDQEAHLAQLSKWIWQAYERGDQWELQGSASGANKSYAHFKRSMKVLACYEHH